ncbi:RHS repeat-associated core domain-containing protein, partial [Escherichia coli]
HRYYDPLQGRYITQDPIGLKGGWNFYQYPLNPVQYIDPLGLADMNFYDESLRRNVSLHAATDKINIPGV